jgi:hypothetical protein
MTTTTDGFAQWLAQARISEQRLTPAQRGLLQAAFAFRQRCGTDYFSTRLVSHFLLHCDSGLKVAAIARLLGLSRPTASGQQGLSSKQVVQSAHHRLAGRPYGKLLPRYAGPIAGFLFAQPQAGRYDVLDFIERAWGIHVSTVALHHFLKKYGLDRATRSAPAAPAAPAAPGGPPAPAEAQSPSPFQPVVTIAAGQPLPATPPPFSAHTPSTPVPSC